MSQSISGVNFIESNFALALFVSVLVAGCWLLIGRPPYDVPILFSVLIPWVAVWFAARHQEQAFFTLRPSELPGDLSLPLLLPGFLLLARAEYDTQAVDGEELLWMALEGAAACVLLIVIAVPSLRARMGFALLLGVSMFAYSSGGLSMANMRFDGSAATIHTVEVLQKRLERSGRPSFSLRVGPWGSRRYDGYVKVGRDLYERIRQRGQEVCVHTYPGALSVPWYEVRDCAG